jgi:hypothetical protein
MTGQINALTAQTVHAERIERAERSRRYADAAPTRSRSPRFSARMLSLHLPRARHAATAR